MKEKIVKIEWVDAMNKGPWVNQEQAEHFAKHTHILTAVGYLIADNKDWLVLSMGKNPEMNAYLTVFKVPKGSVKKITELR